MSDRRPACPICGGPGCPVCSHTGDAEHCPADPWARAAELIASGELDAKLAQRAIDTAPREIPKRRCS